MPRQLHQWWCYSNVSQNASPMSHRSIVFWNNAGTWWYLTKKHDWTQENQVRFAVFLNEKQPPSMPRYDGNWCSTKNIFFRGQLLVDPWMNRISWYFRCWALTALQNPHPCVFSIFVGVSSRCFWIQLGNMLGQRGYDLISDQIVATSRDLAPKGSWGRKISLFRENLGWWNIIISPVICFK